MMTMRKLMTSVACVALVTLGATAGFAANALLNSVSRPAT